jgi:hypothetical protein
MEHDRGEITVVRPMTTEPNPIHERYAHVEAHWPVYWSAIWVGALAALGVALLFGLAAIALGAHQVGPARNIARWSDFGLGALIFSVVGGFIAFVVGGWATSKIAGFRHGEPAALHGAVMWLVTIPMLLVLAAFGAGNYFGGWYGGLAGSPMWAVPATAVVDPTAAAAARNGALGALTALLIGLVGAVLGGWMASGEPMSLARHHEDDVRVTRRAA